MNPYESLANAIVLQAVKDYRAALKRLKKKPSNKDAMADAMEWRGSSIPSGSRCRPTRMANI